MAPQLRRCVGDTRLLVRIAIVSSVGRGSKLRSSATAGNGRDVSSRDWPSSDSGFLSSGRPPCFKHEAANVKDVPGRGRHCDSCIDDAPSYHCQRGQLRHATLCVVAVHPTLLWSMMSRRESHHFAHASATLRDRRALGACSTRCAQDPATRSKYSQSQPKLPSQQHTSFNPHPRAECTYCLHSPDFAEALLQR